MVISRTLSRTAPRKNWTWLYVASFILVAMTAYNIEREIEMNQLPLAVDYN